MISRLKSFINQVSIIFNDINLIQLIIYANHWCLSGFRYNKLYEQHNYIYTLHVTDPLAIRY